MISSRDLEHAKLLYSTQQTISILEISRSELYREMARGRITAIRIGRARRFSRVELERYVAAKYAAETQGVQEI